MQYKKKFNPRQILNSDNRCHKCEDPKCIEGFQCSACKYQCRNCHKFGHFSSLCYQKQKSHKETSSRSPKAQQQKIGRAYVPDEFIYGQSDDNSSNNESFCLQIKLQAKQADTNALAPQHLFTNLEVKMKPHQTKTKFLHNGLDTCTDVNIMPCSVYQLLFMDPDCTKLAPSDLQLGTYTNKKASLL